MVRSYWKGTLVAAALSSGAWLAWGQPMLLPKPMPNDNPAQQVQAGGEPLRPVPAGSEAIAAPAAPGTPAATERIITVQDPGCPARQCRVLREWVLAEGSNAMEVQALDNGEKMTIVCGSCSQSSTVGSPQCCPDDYPCARIQGGISRIFKWGRDCCAPAECPRPPLCQPSGPDCCQDSCKAKGSLSDLTDKRFIDPCTGKFDYEKYLAELRAKHGECGPECGACNAPAGPEKIQTMPAPNAAANGNGETRWPILSAIVGHPIGVPAQPELKTDAKVTAPAVTTLPPANDKDKAKVANPDASSESVWKKWFGGDDHPVSGSGADGNFDKDKYLAELRQKYGHDKDKADTSPAVAKAEQPKKDDKDAKLAKAEPKKTDAKPPTATPPKPTTLPPAVAQAKPPEKPKTEPAQPTDWRKSWGKTDTQVTKSEAPVVKKDLPAAPTRTDPLLDKDKLAQHAQPKVEVKVAAQVPPPAPKPVTPAPVAKPAEPMPSAPVVKEEAPGKASTVQVPMGAASVMAAYGDLKPGQAVYLPVPMVTMPPNAHMVQPPQGPENLPPAVNQYFANAFSAPDAPIMPAGQDPQMAQNAFGNNPQMMPPVMPPMGYPGAPMMPPPMMQQAMMQQAMMQQAMMQQAMMQQGMQQPMMPNAGVMQAGYTPMAAPVQQYQQPGCDPQTAQNLMQTLHDSIYPSQREWAAESLARIDWRTHPQVFDALLSAARDDPAATVRSCCVRCLSSMNVNSSVVTMTLQALKNDSDPRVRNEVDQALAKMQPQPVKSAVQPVSATQKE